MCNKNLSDFELPDNRKIKIKIKKFKTVKPLNEMTLFSVKICRNEFLKVKKNVLLNYITRTKISYSLYIQLCVRLNCEFCFYSFKGDETT